MVNSFEYEVVTQKEDEKPFRFPSIRIFTANISRRNVFSGVLDWGKVYLKRDLYQQSSVLRPKQSQKGKLLLIAQLRIIRVNLKFQSSRVNNFAEREVKNPCQEFEYPNVTKAETEHEKNF